MQHIKVTKGVILTAGGFVMNEEMINKYLPFQTSFGGAPYGNPWDKFFGDLGLIIQIEILPLSKMNANVINMDEALFWACVFFILQFESRVNVIRYGIFVNSDGKMV